VVEEEENEELAVHGWEVNSKKCWRRSEVQNPRRLAVD
jgi:hypothetical protein